MNAAKTQRVRQPQRNRRLLSAGADDRHDGAAAWIDPVVLGAITIARNEVVIPVGRRQHRHPDERPVPWLAHDPGLLRMGGATEYLEATQQHGGSKRERRGLDPHGFLLATE